MSQVRWARTARGRALVAGMLAALVVGMWTLAASAAPVKITFWHALGGEHGEIIADLVAEFNASQDEVLVDAQYQGNYGTLMQKLMAAVAAGDPPTLTGSYNNWTSVFIDADAITPMARFVNDAQVGLSDDELADFFPAFLEANTWDGVLYSLPFNKSVQVLYYNKDLLDQAGVGVPRTMDELAHAVREVKAKTGVPGLALRPDIDTFAAYFRAFGGEWLDASGNPAFDGEAGVRAIRFIQELVADGSAYTFDGWLDEEFNKGNMAMFIHSNSTIPWVRAGATFAWGTAPVPAGDRPASTVAGQDLVIFATASEEEQLAAWKFVKWLLSPEINARFSVGTGYLPVRRSALETPVMRAYIGQAPEQYASGNESLDRLVFDPSIPAWNDMRSFISEAVESVLLLGVDPQAALSDAARKSRQAILDHM